MAQAARPHVTVVLNGDGGDEDFAGYNLRHRAYSMAEAHAMPSSVRAVARGLSSALPAWRSESSRPYRLTKSLRILGASEWRRNIALMEVFSARELRLLGVNGAGAARDVLEPLWSAAERFEGLDRELFFSFALHLPEQLLVKVDRASMAWSLEARSPLLDREFVEFCATIPAGLKLRNGRGKHIFREALRGVLPDVILDRPKQGFIPPLAEWLRGPLAPLVRDALLSGCSYVSGRYAPAVVRRLVEEHLGGVRNHERRVYSLLNMELWAREFLGGGA
jgi:asparagine synthase (glutamine-hydrolysing)